jgi:hypothetical protein
MVPPEGSGQVPDHSSPKLVSQGEELICEKDEDHATDYLTNKPDSGLDDSRVVSFSSPIIWQHLIINTYIYGLVKFQIIKPRN